MHLIERYSLSTGSKISHPYILESYFPLPIEKYVTFQAQSKFESKDYSMWQDVIDLIFPILQKNNIQIVQLGIPKEIRYKKVIDLCGQTSYNQLAYVMKRSLCHFGPDSLGIHLASTYNIPLVGLYSIIQSNVAGPYFGDKSKQICIESFKRSGNGKPSYSPQENPKSINLIKPEEIANGIFQLLGLNIKVPFETIYIGKKYKNEVIRELIPNSFVVINNPEQPVEIRTDLFFDIKILQHHLSYLKKAVVVTDKRIDINLLKHFKQNIALLVYRIKENDEPKFIQDLTSAGIPYILLSDLSNEEINNKKINYYEYGNINKIGETDQKIIEELKKDINNLYYKSNKYIASNQSIYSSHSQEQNNLPIPNNGSYEKVIDHLLFWQDLEFTTVIKNIQ